MNEPRLARPLFLTGMMGAGKTTVGSLIADRIHAVFMDLDVRIERIAAKTVEDLIRRDLREFRRLEHAVLRSLVSEPGFSHSATVVATGGGIVEDPANRRLMRETGRVVYLSASVEALVARLSIPGQAAARPLLDASSLRESVADRLAAREAFYADSDFRVSADSHPDAVVDSVLEGLKERD